jgi:hypothetical protein
VDGGVESGIEFCRRGRRWGGVLNIEEYYVGLGFTEARDVVKGENSKDDGNECWTVNVKIEAEGV